MASKSEVQMKDIENISLFQEKIIPLIQITWLPKVFEIYPVILIKYWWYPSFWLLTLMDSGGHDIKFS